MKKLFAFRISLILISAFFFSAIVSIAQNVDYFECPESNYPFTGTAVQTLCESIGANFNANEKVGAGSAFSSTDDFGGSFVILSGNILVIGDFEINTPAVFYNANVKIAPGAKINITHNSGGNIVSLRIQNSKLFACDGLWKGIEMSGESYIVTNSNSTIEDAEKAISATINDVLSIEKTTFNRNLTGLDLNNPNPQLSAGPKVILLSQNNFTCDAPINGTINQISDIGIRINHAKLFAETAINSFRNQVIGVWMGGSTSVLSAKFFRMNRIASTGIRAFRGMLKIQESRFENFEEIGIDILRTSSAIITDTDFFIHGLATSQFTRTGVRATEFGFNSILSVERCTLKMLMANTIPNIGLVTDFARGVHLIGGNVSFGTTININENEFTI